MTQLAIKGHALRGKEVIEILEMLGGKSNGNIKGYNDDLYYYIAKDGLIYGSGIKYEEFACNYTIFTLEKFLEKYPYKVGDRVTYRADKLLETQLITNMCWDSDYDCVLYYLDDCNIIKVDDILYRIGCPEDNIPATEEKPDIGLAPDLKGEDYSGRRFGYKIPNGYEFECVRKNEIILKPIKPQYPKTYKECCDVLGLNTMDNDAKGYKHLLLIQFQELIIARDAYWKIASEELGLDKPWEPDFTNNDEERYGIYTTANNVEKDFCGVGDVNTILVFPTEEMRDAFFENFKNLIEDCKELL